MRITRTKLSAANGCERQLAWAGLEEKLAFVK
jgi:hypothetical protein